jgi:hypothetical protein
MLESVEVFRATRVWWWVYVWLEATRVCGKNHQGRVEDTGHRLVPLYPEHNNGMPWFRGAYAVTASIIVFELRNLVQRAWLELTQNACLLCPLTSKSWRSRGWYKFDFEAQGSLETNIWNESSFYRLKQDSDKWLYQGGPTVVALCAQLEGACERMFPDNNQHSLDSIFVRSRSRGSLASPTRKPDRVAWMRCARR